MKRCRTANGLLYYKTTAEETENIGGCGICDECGARPNNGYLIPVLNHWQCEECFTEWQERAIRYEEDRPIEQRRAQYYEAMIPCEN